MNPGRIVHATLQRSNLLPFAGAQGAGSTARRDLLLGIQAAAQKRWSELNVFEVDAPAEGGWSAQLQQSLGTVHAHVGRKLAAVCSHRHTQHMDVLQPSWSEGLIMSSAACHPNSQARLTRASSLATSPTPT